MGANERAAIQACDIPYSWKAEYEKPGLFALYLLQSSEIAVNCCSVVPVLYQIKGLFSQQVLWGRIE